MEGLAVTVAMYCLIQFYVQLRTDLAPHQPFLKVAAIKLVIFLSFWQTFMISILTSSTLSIVTPTSKIAYPDLKIGIPSLLLCIEMAIFSILHLFAFRYQPYTQRGAQATAKEYPISPSSNNSYPVLNEVGPKQGGFLGIKAFADAMNPWDLVKGFARGMRWLFVGRKHREKDASYKNHNGFDLGSSQNDMTLGPDGLPKMGTAYQGGHRYKNTADLPIANEFRRSKFGMPSHTLREEEEATLLANAQNPGGSGYVPARQRYDSNGQYISTAGSANESAYARSPDRLMGQNSNSSKQEEQSIGMAVSGSPPRQVRGQGPQAQLYMEQKRQARQQRQQEEEDLGESPTQYPPLTRPPGSVPYQMPNRQPVSQPYLAEEGSPPQTGHSHANDELWGAEHNARP